MTTDHNKLSFSERRQEAVTNCNLDSSGIMKEDGKNDLPCNTRRISIYNEMTQYIKNTSQHNNCHEKPISKSHEAYNADTYKPLTDGSKAEQGVAFAVYSENFSSSKRVSSCTSVFTAELYGILEAINYSVNVAEGNILLYLRRLRVIQKK